MYSSFALHAECFELLRITKLTY